MAVQPNAFMLVSIFFFIRIVIPLLLCVCFYALHSLLMPRHFFWSLDSIFFFSLPFWVHQTPKPLYLFNIKKKCFIVIHDFMSEIMWQCCIWLFWLEVIKRNRFNISIYLLNWIELAEQWSQIRWPTLYVYCLTFKVSALHSNFVKHIINFKINKYLNSGRLIGMLEGLFPFNRQLNIEFNSIQFNLSWNRTR